MWMSLKSCSPWCEQLAEIFCSPVSSLSHVQHTQDKQHVWFWRKWTEKKVCNDYDDRWSLYTKKAQTLGQSLLGWSICRFSFLPTRFICWYKQWMVTQKPHDATVPKRGVMVKNHETLLQFLPLWSSARRPSCSFLQKARFSQNSLVTETQTTWGTFDCEYIAVHFSIPVITWLEILILHEFTSNSS